MVTYKTPGVYVEEISTIPPSVAEVSTAIPAFIGYTERGYKGEPTIARIDTLLEYETLFGSADPSFFTITTGANASTGFKEIERVRREASPTAEFLMYYSLRMYFKNGGGSCYVVSIGTYDTTPAVADFEAGLAELEKEDEATLILLTDAVNLASVDYYALCQQALAQCNKLGDRFAILDVWQGDVEVFRANVGTNHLMYGAAYHPYLQTSLAYQYDEDGIRIEDTSADASRDTPAAWQGAFGESGIVVSYDGSREDAPRVRIVAGTASEEMAFSISDVKVLTIEDVAGKTGAQVATAWRSWTETHDAAGFDIWQNGDGSGEVPHTSSRNVDLDAQAVAGLSVTMTSIRSTETSLYNQIKTRLSQQRVILPPSAAIAGIYAQVDRDRGVWKAPANVSLSSTIGPVSKITHEDQESLNVDPTAGKSINAIRAFTGKGTLVWGARTLAGNDNEWRYVSVRRLFNVIEESTRKATAFAVFEPNDTTTWLKVKAMIESYLYGLWEQGAFAGSTSDAAYFVNVGLGKTMTGQDVLEGRMIVEIGVAAVRPAEFIILKFSHKLQEA